MIEVKDRVKWRPQHTYPGLDLADVEGEVIHKSGHHLSIFVEGLSPHISPYTSKAEWEVTKVTVVADGRTMEAENQTA